MFPGSPVARRRSSLIATSLFVIGIATVPISQAASAQSNVRQRGFFAVFGERMASTVVSNAPPTDAVPSTQAPPLTITVTPTRPAIVVVAHCVRLCDGRYFPVPLSSSLPHTTPMMLCKALCPASKTRIYIGIDIDGAFATNGARYSDLTNAFRYRKELVADCTCNGKDVIGTAAVDIAADPTLRTGDIIATRQGLRVFTGPVRDTHRAKDFRPVEKFPRLSAGLRTKVKW